MVAVDRGGNSISLWLTASILCAQIVEVRYLEIIPLCINSHSLPITFPCCSIPNLMLCLHSPLADFFLRLLREMERSIVGWICFLWVKGLAQKHTPFSKVCIFAQDSWHYSSVIILPLFSPVSWRNLSRSSLWETCGFLEVSLQKYVHHLPPPTKD